MARPAKSQFVCQNCGAVAPRWAGKCAACGEWNTLIEEADVAAAPGSGLTRSSKGRVVELETLTKTTDKIARIPTGLAELDRVTGGGIVPGSALLIGGEPGIGKSTLLLQLAAAFASAGRRAIYFSGEEAAAQVRLRAERLGLSDAPLALACETNVGNILATLGDGKRPDLVVVDSIQTLWADALEAAPGTVSQVRAATQSLVRYAKAQGAALVLVGHVTKDGQIAGPKVIEHMVDTVLYFEGEGMLEHRILRATKNRFGSVDEIGVFRMTEEGLIPVENPSELFLGDRLNNSSGSAVTALLEGSRPVLIEIQGLAAKAGYGTPQRVSTGYDGRRLALLLAVLDKRAGLSFSQLDVFLNVVGGVRMQEPAGDLAVASALASSVYDRPVANSSIFLGEVGLGGEIRPVSQAERRLGEAAKMGMTTAYMAERGIPKRGPRGLEIVGVRTINDLFRQLFHA